jgi:hypothetical protein
LEGRLVCRRELDQDGLGAAEDSTGTTGLDSTDGAGAIVGDGLDDELQAPTNSAAATINIARTALMKDLLVLGGSVHPRSDVV